MIDKKTNDALNAQINEEMASAYLYLAMAADFEAKNWKGAAAWMKKQAAEEMEHAMKFYAYINERGGKAEFAELKKPQSSWKNHLEAFEAAYKHEQHITGCINRLMKAARDASDYATENLLNWYINEQVEEEANADEIVQKLKLVGDNTNGLFMIDHELGKRKED
jgi:ferritin